MPASANGTNFVINSCEWWNGQHVIFATAESLSHFEGIPNDTGVTYGHAVSQMVNLTFNNLVTEIAFSQPYFEPSLGQTQQLTAQLAANCNWTLQIQDINNNTVRNASGSGNSILFNWDGTGNGGTNIPDGVYTYSISAHTNGQANQQIANNVSNGAEVSSPSFSTSTTVANDLNTQLYVTTPDGSGGVFPLAIYPPNANTNGLVIFQATPTEIRSLIAKPVRQISSSDNLIVAGNFIAKDSSSVSPSESTIVPMRPPTARVKGAIGTFYVGYNAYIIQSGSFTTQPISTGWPWPVPPQYVALDGRTQSQASQTENFGCIYEHTGLAGGFAYAMQNGGWQGSINGNISASDVTGGIFNQANVGLLLVHGSYGTTAEIDGVKHSYLRFFDQNTFSPSYCRLDDCNFGGSGTNGLKWMAILACNALADVDYNSMYLYARLPISTDLHMLLSTATIATAAPRLGSYWANRLLGDGTTNNPPQSVANAWFNGAQAAYNNSDGYGETNHITIKFRVAYWPDAINETVSAVKSSPSTGNPLDIQKTDSIVFSNP